MFEGTMREGFRHGDGILVEGKMKYTGPFVNGFKEGRGILSSIDGEESTTHGFWVYGQLDGVVTIAKRDSVEDTIYNMGQEVIFGHGPVTKPKKRKYDEENLQRMVAE